MINIDPLEITRKFSFLPFKLVNYLEPKRYIEELILARRIKYGVDTLIVATKPIGLFHEACCARHGQKKETATREAIQISA